MELAFVSAPDIAVVFIVALVVFGPKRLPDVGRQLGHMVRELRKATGEFTDIFHETREDILSAVKITEPPAPPTGRTTAWDQAGGGELMAQSPRLGAVPTTEEAGPQAPVREAGLVISTVPKPQSTSGEA